MRFIDSNVFVYAADSKNHTKRAIARELISTAVLSGGCRINVQVLNEFSSVLYLKYLHYSFVDSIHQLKM